MSSRARAVIRIAMVLAGAAALAGCAGSAGAPTWTFPPTHTAPAAAAAVAAPGNAGTGSDPTVGTPRMAAAAGARMTAAGQQGAGAAATQGAGSVTRLDLTIVTGDMTGHDEYPAYIPSDFTLPANSTVVVTITNFDDATPLPSTMAQYATVQGTLGNTMQVTPIEPGDPNGSIGSTATLGKLDPADVSHTFTIPALGTNVPIAPHARVTFVIRTGAPGTYYWRCFDPCGAGPTGWGTAMAAKRGFMEGTLTVA